MDKERLQKISEVLWQIPKDTRKDMRVPAWIFSKENMLEALLSDRSLDQLVNVATLQGIQKAAIVMPDAHEGYGFPIGGVAATSYSNGVISPGGIGYDINCGVRLLVTQLDYKDIEHHLEELSKELYRQVPSGLGQGGFLKLNTKQIDSVLKKGALWAVEKGYGDHSDLEHIESHGRLTGADPSCVSINAKKRGHDQLGTIGSGNHFAEIDRVEQVFDKGAAYAFGLRPDQIVVLIHTGSRGLGHQVATDYLKLMMKSMEKYAIKPPDRELACVPFRSEEGQKYFRAMKCAANYAWCNREIITWEVRKAMDNVFGDQAGHVSVLYDVAHNIAKLETHVIAGKEQKVIVHRKGATRAFGPGFEELPLAFRHIGQPVLIPGSMGTASYVLAGTEKSMEASFGSCCHGAGRRLSRRAAKKQVDAPGLIRQLKDQGTYVQAGSYRGVAEEAPIAYKDVDSVVETVHDAGLAKKVARLRPLAVVKG
ncbi:MAG: RtcB family protein [Saprospiraceae bacterium]|nr:RtcB family protein [Saprospiraceae bacterium]